MKKRKKENETDEFKIRDPKWTFWTCLLAMVGCLAVFFALLFLESQGVVGAEALSVGYIFAALALISAAGIYAWIYQRLTYSNGIYRYYNPFGKNQRAAIDDVETVKILTVHYATRDGMIRKKNKILFFGRGKTVLMKISDDGTISENAVFLKSLKINRVRIVHEEKHEY